MTKQETWCPSFYNLAFADYYLDRPYNAQMQKTVAFISDKLDLMPDNRIFEQCCGIGSISHALTRNKFKTIGIDIIPDYIDRAKSNAQKLNLDCNFYTENAYTYKTDTLCDGAINWWTSFGYDADDNVNIQMLDRLYDSLKPGAKILIDFMNSYQNKRAFLTTDQTTEQFEHNGVTHIWQSEYDHNTNLITKSWSIKTADGQVSELQQGGGVKAYELDDFTRLLNQAGFGNIEFFGSIDGETFTQDSPRLITLAEKIS